MPFLQCLYPRPGGGICGRLSKQTRCPEHRRARKQLYGPAHQKARKTALALRPKCNHCGHMANSATGRCGDPLCKKCPLQLDHLEPVLGGRSRGDSRRQLLCRKCNRAKSDS